MAIDDIYLAVRMLSRYQALPAGVRKLSTTNRTVASHYDVLGITPKATQTDIKSAYYKLSKVYHPDKSDNEESAKKFRAISEAYEVLGNIKLKKMYDKGLIVGKENTTRMDYSPDPEPTDPTLRFYKSRLNRQVAPTMDGRTPIYDFDSWSKRHYGELFTRAQYQKDFINKKNAKQNDRAIAQRQEAMIYILFALGGLIFVFVVHGQEDFDKNMLITRNSVKNVDKKNKEQTKTNEKEDTTKEVPKEENAVKS